VAIKLLRPDHDFNPNQVERFLKEIRAVARLDHPNLIRATDAGEADGRHFLAMEFVPGVDLSQVVATCAPLSIANACEAIRQTAIGLKHLHENGFVHRDLKPSNLLLTSARQIKLLDLGLVQTIPGHGATDDSSEDPPSKQPHWPDGTPDYMPPEQWNLQPVDLRSDLYSLGCTLFKLLTGTAPYRPLPDGFADRCAAHCKAAIPSITALRRCIASRSGSLVSRRRPRRVDNRSRHRASTSGIDDWPQTDSSPGDACRSFGNCSSRVCCVAMAARSENHYRIWLASAASRRATRSGSPCQPT
jgi:serine/threonine protein kinase